MNSSVLPLQPGFLNYVSLALKVGTAITAFIGIVKAITEWTAPGRRNRALEKATRLAAFLDAVTKMAPTGGGLGANSDLVENAHREFIIAANRCFTAKRMPSRLRRAFLIYLPPRLVAYIPHFLFFTLCTLAVSALIGIGGDIPDKSADVGDLTVVLVIGFLAYFMQQWASLEWRRGQGIHLPPRTLYHGLKWYPANSFWGLFANSLLIIYPIFMAASFTATGSNSQIDFSIWPVWQLAMLGLVSCHLTVVAFFWPRAEYLLYSGEVRLLSIRDLMLRATRPQSPESAIGIVTLFLLTIWCSTLLLDFKFVHQIASSADGSVGTAGQVGAWTALITIFFLYGLIPWIAVYRGLSNLLDYRPGTAKEVRCG